jgi:radical SAM protein with 4Fe4S-binding SPASM domain
MDNGYFSIDKELCKRLKKWNIQLLQIAVRINERTAKQECKGPYKFHQFIKVHEGPVNSAIFDTLKGDIYQVPTQTIRLFKEGDYEKIGEFIADAEGLDLIIKTNLNTWIPDTKAWDKRVRDELTTVDYVLLHIEDRIDPAVIMKMVKKFKIVSIKYYGSDKIEDSMPGVDIIYAQKDFAACRKSAAVAEGNFNKIEKDAYQFNKVCNSCWGHKIAITKDGKIRPCIYSDIVIADVCDIDKKETIDKILSYWFITKDRVERCKDCEFKYVCNDCREIAQRANNGNLFAANPDCKYNPYTGEWKN